MAPVSTLTLRFEGEVGLSAANILMRDPLLYRIRKSITITGDAWCIYYV